MAVVVAGSSENPALPLPPGPGPEELVLRPYQEQSLQDLREAFKSHRWVLFCLPTGAGKTILFGNIAAVAASQGLKACVIVHRVELAHQVAAVFARLGVPCGLIAAGEPENVTAPIQIAVINSLHGRVRRGRYHGVFRLCVLDECHHCVAAMWHQTVPAILAERGRVLGVSASPVRHDGAGLDVFRDGTPAFETLVCGPDVAELVAQGFLARAETYIPAQLIDTTGVKVRGGDFDQAELARATLRQPEIIGDAVAHYRRLANGKAMLAFCASVEHSQLVAQAFNAAGIAARHVDCETPPAERKAAVSGIADGGLKVLCNYALYTEGLDLPGIAGVIVIRKTLSFGLWKQMVGRGLRIFPGKTRALIVDHVGGTMVHGLFDEPVQWSLTGRKRDQRQGEAGAVLVRRCPECGAANRISAPSCEACGCGFQMPRRGRVPEAVDGELQKIEDELTFRLRRMSYRQLLAWAGGDRERLTAAALARGYRKGWVFRREFEHAMEQRGGI
jgi:DNA repair protein RadD